MAADEAVSDVDEMEKQAESSSFRNELDERQPESDELERSCCGEVDELSDVSDAFFNRLTKSSPSLLFFSFKLKSLISSSLSLNSNDDDDEVEAEESARAARPKSLRLM